MQVMTVRRVRKTVPLIAIALLLLMAGGLVGYALYIPVYSEASGTNVIRDGKVSIDISNASNGYVMVKHDGSSKRLKLRVHFGEEYQTYDLNNQGRYEAFPLSKGSGTYKLVMYENTKGDSYSKLSSKSVKVTLYDENAPFLCPNQNAWYTSDMQAVQKSYELCAGINDEWGKVEAIYNFVSKNVVYDYLKALTVQNAGPYFPVVDDTLSTRTGICFDYAALLACMLRVQGIPTQLVVGDLIPASQRHAWNKIYVGGSWLQVDATFPNGTYKQADYAELYVY